MFFVIRKACFSTELITLHSDKVKYNWRRCIVRVERCKHYFSVQFVYLKCEIRILFCFSRLVHSWTLLKFSFFNFYLVALIKKTQNFCSRIRQLFEIKFCWSMFHVTQRQNWPRKKRGYARMTFEANGKHTLSTWIFLSWRKILKHKKHIIKIWYARVKLSVPPFFPAATSIKRSSAVCRRHNLNY